MADKQTRKPFFLFEWSHHGMWSGVRARLIAGVATLIPIFVTLYLFLFLSNQIQRLFRPVTEAVWESVGVTIEPLDMTNTPQSRPVPPRPATPPPTSGQEDVPEGVDKQIQRLLVRGVNVALSWVLAFLTIYLIGLFSATLVVRRLIGVGERIVDRIPIIKTVYGTAKQIVDTFSMQQSKSFQKVVIIEYPRRDLYAMGFVTGETRYAQDPRLYVNVFIPTTPNPTSGFLLIFPSEDVRETGLTVEQAFKFIISGGILTLSDLPLRPYTPLENEPTLGVMKPSSPEAK